MDDASAALAGELGVPKSRYLHIERERRWLCDAMPDVLTDHHKRIEDRYIVDTRMRLRRVRNVPGEVAYKLSRKIDLDSARRAMTTLYLTAAEHAVLATLPAHPLAKTRHYVKFAGVFVGVDVFEGPLSGLITAEVEFDTDEQMAAFPSPPWAAREVTDDMRYSGGNLAGNGIG